MPVVSKVFEILLIKQISLYVQEYLSPYLRGYRKGFSTQQALLSLIERWKNVLDKKGYAGSVLMDLSKALDTLNHDLFIAKLYAYGFFRKVSSINKKLLNKSLAKEKGECEF